MLGLCVAFAALLGLQLFAAGGAAAHAQLEATSPAQGAVLQSAPRQVEFRFSEAVEVAFGSVRVFDGAGARVDTGPTLRPEGEKSIGVALRPGLGDGAYTATYRVVSADSHPISGGFSFQVGEAGAVAPKSVSSLLTQAGASAGIQVLYGAARFVGYLALCLVVGVLAFWLIALSPFVREDQPAAASFARRARPLVTFGAASGLLSAIVAIICQAAIAGGTGLADALSWTPLQAVAETRSGSWMAVRVVAWAVLCAVWLVGRRRFSSEVLTYSVLAIGAFTCLTPVMSGHAAATDPRWLIISCDYVHVLAMAVWVGGLIAAVFALPSATRELPADRRTGVLVEVFARFSAVALGAVFLLVATGVIQSVIHLEAFSDLWEVAFGRALTIKALLLLLLVGLGAYNRFRVVPGLRARAAAGDQAGAVGVALKRALTAEVVIAVVVIVVASALVAYSPAATTNRGPFAEDATIGPLSAQLIIDPARQGANELHVYLTDPRSGRQFDKAKEVTVQLSEPKAGIGPLNASLRVAGPGHYTDSSAMIPVTGEWEALLVVRLTEFDQHEHIYDVKVR